jgi:hypothetical protein
LHYFDLVASRKVKTQNPELARAISLWSASHQLDDDIYVKALVESLESGVGVHQLSRYDATETLPHPEIQGGRKQSAFSENLIGARNILVFVPVALTWAGISQATEAYSKYTLANPNTIINFFDFWENGYGVLSDFWTLSSITRIGFILLTLIILASTAIAVLQKQATTLKAQAEKEIAKERFNLGFQINQFLFQFNSITPAEVSQSALLAIRDLRATSNSIARLSKSSEKSAAELTKGSPIRKQLDAIKKLIEKNDK